MYSPFFCFALTCTYLRMRSFFFKYPDSFVKSIAYYTLYNIYRTLNYTQNIKLLGRHRHTMCVYNISNNLNVYVGF